MINNLEKLLETAELGTVQRLELGGCHSVDLTDTAPLLPRPPLPPLVSAVENTGSRNTLTA